MQEETVVSKEIDKFNITNTPAVNHTWKYTISQNYVNTYLELS